MGTGTLGVDSSVGLASVFDVLLQLVVHVGLADFLLDLASPQVVEPAHFLGTDPFPVHQREELVVVEFDGGDPDFSRQVLDQVREDAWLFHRPQNCVCLARIGHSVTKNEGALL